MKDREPNILRRAAIATTLALVGVGNGVVAEDAICSPKFTDTHIFPGDDQTFRNVKRAIFTGDANFPDQGIFIDSDALTAEMVIIEFPEHTNLTNVDAKFEGNLREFTSCATNGQFNRVIGKMERAQLKGKPTEFSVNTYHIPRG